jgi:hypothetical protein
MVENLLKPVLIDAEGFADFVEREHVCSSSRINSVKDVGSALRARCNVTTRLAQQTGASIARDLRIVATLELAQDEPPQAQMILPSIVRQLIHDLHFFFHLSSVLVVHFEQTLAAVHELQLIAHRPSKVSFIDSELNGAIDLGLVVAELSTSFPNFDFGCLVLVRAREEPADAGQHRGPTGWDSKVPLVANARWLRHPRSSDRRDRTPGNIEQWNLASRDAPHDGYRSCHSPAQARKSRRGHEHGLHGNPSPVAVAA